MKMLARTLLATAMLGTFSAKAQIPQKNSLSSKDSVIHALFDLALTQGHAYARLGELCNEIGPRLSGSDNAERGIQWAVSMLKSYQFNLVDTQTVFVPRWERGSVEEVKFSSALLSQAFKSKDQFKAFQLEVLKSTYPNSPYPSAECESFLNTLKTTQKMYKIPAVALGGSVAGKMTAPVIAIQTKRAIDSLGQLGLLKGKIVLLNRPMDEKLLNTFQAYGGCVSQRVQGANWCAPYGALAVLVRSVSNRCDLHAHTGVTHYDSGVKQIPMAAVATAAADVLQFLSMHDPSLMVQLELTCKTLPDRASANVLAQTNGGQYPEKIIAFGGHFDSWDEGQGAHDDGAGCMHAFEALRLLKMIGYQPKHTLRCVFWINEENGLRGGLEYARRAKLNHEKHIVALESDRGGFTPRGFGVDSLLMLKLRHYAPILENYGIGTLEKGGGGADIGPLKTVDPSTQFVSFIPDSQRYFDVHHAETDVFSSVNKRELAMGAAAVAAIIYLIDSELD